MLFRSAALLASCATISYHDRMKYYGSPRSEFVDTTEARSMFEGVLVDDRLIRNGKPYYHLQFERVMDGAGRYLDLYLPHDTSDASLVFESNVKKPGKRASFLLLERTCCSNEYGEFSDPLKTRDLEKNPERLFDIVRDKLKKNVTRADLPIVFVKLVFSNVFKYDIIYTVWKAEGGDATSFSWNACLQLSYDTIDVKWKNRSRALYGLSKVGYVGPVIVDIVTSPIQLIAAILYFGMGGAVK